MESAYCIENVLVRTAQYDEVIGLTLFFIYRDWALSLSLFLGLHSKVLVGIKVDGVDVVDYL